MKRKRRFWSDEEKRRVVAETRVSGVSVAAVARRYDINANQVFNCVFRSIRPLIPTTCAHLFRGIRPPLTLCGEAVEFGYQV